MESPTQHTVNESSNKISFVAVLDKASTSDVTVDLLVNGTVEAEDYTSESTLTFPAGDTALTITIGIVDDAEDELDETITITITNPNGATLGTPSSLSFTIVDNDIPSLQFANESQKVDENTGEISVNLSLDIPVCQNISVPYTITGSADKNDDFTIPGTVDIMANNNSGTIPVDIIDDVLDEPDETILITLGNPTHASLGEQENHTITITDNDTPKVSWSVTSREVAENVGTIDISATLDIMSYTQITVPFTITGSASDQDDYSIADSTIEFPPNTQTKTISLSIIKD
ncbi:MAG: hypothetical protein OMM_14232, partial [Candidatus Magnetoglobus multicellularis str. Araruama]